MTTYIVIIGILAVLSLLEHDGGGNAPGKTACTLLIVFGGLRHETGFDWIEYENYFELMRPIWSSQPQYIESPLLVEPGFAFFTLVVRSLGLPFQALLLIITTINMVVIYSFCKRYTNRIAFVFLVYFGFVFLAGQMAAIRQTLSYSFLLLAFIQCENRRTWPSVALVIVAVSIHTFSIVFVPLIYLRVRILPVWIVTAIVVVGVGTAVSGFYIVPVVADVILSVVGAGFLATKLSLYGDYEGSALSLASLLFIPLHLYVYYLLTTRRYTRAEEPTALTYLTIAVTLMSLVTHSYFGLFPALWNRVSYLTFLLQPIALAQKYRPYWRAELPVITTGLATAASVSIIVYTLSAPTSLPFTPYQNAALAWVTGDQGDGRWRYAYAFRQAELEIANRRR